MPHLNEHSEEKGEATRLLNLHICNEICLFQRGSNEQLHKWLAVVRLLPVWSGPKRIWLRIRQYANDTSAETACLKHRFGHSSSCRSNKGYACLFMGAEIANSSFVPAVFKPPHWETFMFWRASMHGFSSTEIPWSREWILICLLSIHNPEEIL
jgi:hypothetical protein